MYESMYTNVNNILYTNYLQINANTITMKIYAQIIALKKQHVTHGMLTYNVQTSQASICSNQLSTRVPHTGANSN